MRLHKNTFIFLLILFIGSFFVFKFISDRIDLNLYFNERRHGIVDYLKERLVFEKYISTDNATDIKEKKAILYVLGGNQGSLRQRYLKASELYHLGLSRKIMILSRPGITEFNPNLGRNLTNDEWSIRELSILNVQKKDIELVSVKPGYFGTLQEAMRVTEINRKRGGGRIILVTSSYHTRRAFLSFSEFQKNPSNKIYVYGTVDAKNIINIISEYVKLFLYEKFLLPAWSTFRENTSYDE